jgi:hypothetical protein
MVIRVLPVENAGSTSPSGRNWAAWVRVNAGLSASGVADRGDASTAAQLMATGASEALSFKLVLLTVVGLSERNNMRALWRGATKQHHHQASFNPVVTNESRLWVSLARVFSHHHFRIKHDPRSQKRQTTLAYVGVVFDDVAREFHLENYMHLCMHKLM